MSNTPRTDFIQDAIASESPILGNRYNSWAEFARQLERENSTTQERVTMLETALRKARESLSTAEMFLFERGTELKEVTRGIARIDAALSQPEPKRNLDHITHRLQ